MKPAMAKTLIALAFFLCAGGVYAQSAIEKLVEQTGVRAGDVALRDMSGWREPQKIVVRDIGLTLDEMQQVLPGVEIVIVESQAEATARAAGADAVAGYCGEALMAAASDAIWIQVFSAGVERCLSNDRIANGSVVLTNMQKMAAPVIAEHVTAMILSLARRLPQYSKAMTEGSWLDESPMAYGMQSIAGKTVLVAGLGGIGTEVARRAAALGMRVVGTRRSAREAPDFVEYVGLSDELHDLAGRADFIVNALPFTPETSELFDATFFAAAKRGAHFVNVGRGRSVVTADLVAALESGQIAGAALDVTEPEPLPADHPLWQMDNVIITPHVAGNGSNRMREGILLMENLRRFAAGDALLNVVDPKLGY